MPLPAAVALARRRWAGKSDEERRAHGQMMSEAAKAARSRFKSEDAEQPSELSRRPTPQPATQE